jgi:hypothetical protein
MYGYEHTGSEGDGWYDVEDESVRPPMSRRRKLLMPVVALFIVGGAAFTGYALTRNGGEGVANARESVAETLGTRAPPLHMDPVPDRDRVSGTALVEPVIGVKLSTAEAELNYERDDTAVAAPEADPAAQQEVSTASPSTRPSALTRTRAETLPPPASRRASERASSVIEAPVAPDLAAGAATETDESGSYAIEAPTPAEAPAPASPPAPRPDATEYVY